MNVCARKAELSKAATDSDKIWFIQWINWVLSWRHGYYHIHIITCYKLASNLIYSRKKTNDPQDIDQSLLWYYLPFGRQKDSFTQKELLEKKLFLFGQFILRFAIFSTRYEIFCSLYFAASVSTDGMGWVLLNHYYSI